MELPRFPLTSRAAVSAPACSEPVLSAQGGDPAPLHDSSPPAQQAAPGIWPKLTETSGNTGYAEPAGPVGPGNAVVAGSGLGGGSFSRGFATNTPQIAFATQWASSDAQLAAEKYQKLADAPQNQPDPELLILRPPLPPGPSSKAPHPGSGTDSLMRDQEPTFWRNHTALQSVGDL